jgi:16S rRNA (guanine527-N7)-methyltransferase
VSGPRDERTDLKAAAADLGIELSPALTEKFSCYLELLYRWNTSSGLTRVDRADAVRLHLVDSLTALPVVRDAQALADLGTGGGLPGIPLALLLPRVEVTLVETKRRKCSFLREAVRELGLGNCSVIESDARRLDAGGWDTTIARAFMPPQEMLDLSCVLATRRAVVMAGPSVDAADLDIPSHWSLAEALEIALPGGDERRQLLCYDNVTR